MKRTEQVWSVYTVVPARVACLYHEKGWAAPLAWIWGNRPQRRQACWVRTVCEHSRAFWLRQWKSLLGCARGFFFFLHLLRVGLGNLELGALKGSSWLLRNSRKAFGPAGRRWQFLGLLGLRVVMRRLGLEDLGLLTGKWGTRPRLRWWSENNVVGERSSRCHLGRRSQM